MEQIRPNGAKTEETMDLVVFPSSSPPLAFPIPCLYYTIQGYAMLHTLPSPSVPFPTPLFTLQYTRLCQASPFPPTLTGLSLFLFVSISFSVFLFFSLSIFFSPIATQSYGSHECLFCYVPGQPSGHDAGLRIVCTRVQIPPCQEILFRFIYLFSTFHIFLPPTHCQATHGGVIARR